MALNLVYNPVNYDPVLNSPLTPSINNFGFSLSSDRQIRINSSGSINIYDNNNNLVKTILATDPEISLSQLPNTINNNETTYSATSPWIIEITKPVQGLARCPAFSRTPVQDYLYLQNIVGNQGLIIFYCKPNSLLIDSGLIQLQNNNSKSSMFTVVANTINSRTRLDSTSLTSTTTMEYDIIYRIRNISIAISSQSTLGARAV